MSIGPIHIHVAVFRNGYMYPEVAYSEEGCKRIIRRATNSVLGTTMAKHLPVRIAKLTAKEITTEPPKPKDPNDPQ